MLVRTPQPGELASALLASGLTSEVDSEGVLRVRTHEMARVGDVAQRAGQAVHELRTLDTDLEALYFALTTTPQTRNRNLVEAAAGPRPVEQNAAAGQEGARQS